MKKVLTIRFLFICFFHPYQNQTSTIPPSLNIPNVNFVVFISDSARVLKCGIIKFIFQHIQDHISVEHNENP